MAFQVTTSLFGIESKTLLADIKSLHLPYMSIKADPTYEFTSTFFSKTNPSTHLPKPKSPHAPRTLTNVISSGSNPFSLISINNPNAFLRSMILERKLGFGIEFISIYEWICFNRFLDLQCFIRDKSFSVKV